MSPLIDNDLKDEQKYWQMRENLLTEKNIVFTILSSYTLIENLYLPIDF